MPVLDHHAQGTWGQGSTPASSKVGFPTFLWEFIYNQEPSNHSLPPKATLHGFLSLQSGDRNPPEAEGSHPLWAPPSHS